MSKNIRRIAAAASLAVMLSASPAIAAPSRDNGGAKERTTIVSVVKWIAKRVFGLTPKDGLSGPPPTPTITEP